MYWTEGKSPRVYDDWQTGMCATLLTATAHDFVAVEHLTSPKWVEYRELCRARLDHMRVVFSPEEVDRAITYQRACALVRDWKGLGHS